MQHRILIGLIVIPLLSSGCASLAEVKHPQFKQDTKWHAVHLVGYCGYWTDDAVETLGKNIPTLAKMI